jgi:F-type H+-transporting ATPase subunit b
MWSYLAEVIGFVLLGLFIYRYVRPPLKKMMSQQAETIRTSIASASAVQEAAERALADARSALESAQADATAIVESAHQTSAQLRLEGERRGREEHDRLVARVAVEAEFERQRARQEVTRQVGAIVMAATELVVAAELDAARQRSLIGEAIDAAEAMA